MDKMNKKIILVAGIIFLLAIAGCTSGSKDKNPITDIDVRKGVDGLVMTFITNAPPAPPKSVFEGSKFLVGVKLENKGASNIENGLVVFGFEKAYVDGVEEKDKEAKPINIKGKSIYNPAGDEDLIKINAQAKTAGAQSERHPSTILATACYPYQTIFGNSVCIDPDVYSERKTQKVCAMGSLASDTGQGAPVAVTEVETGMTYVDENNAMPQFLIHVENRGNGEVTNPDPGIINKACTSGSLEYRNLNILKISASLSGASLKCVPEEIRLKEKKGISRCDSEISIPKTRDAYTAPLEIKLDYGYTFTIPQDIVIEKILKK